MGRPTSLELEIGEVTWFDYDGNQYPLVDEAFTVELFESIDCPFVHGNLKFNDNNGITEFNNGYSGGYLKLKFRTNEAFPWIDKQLWVYKVGNDESKEGAHQVSNRNVHLYFASMPMELEQVEHYSKVYKNMKPHEIVTAVAQDMLGITIQKTDATKDILDYTWVPYTWSPMDIINYCRKKSYSVANDDTGYVFFEDSTGFNYVSISELLSQGPKYELIMKPVSDSNLRDAQFQFVGKVIDYKVHKHVDLMEAWANHRFGGSIHYFDIDKKKWEEKKHKLDPAYLGKTMNLGTKTVTHQFLSNERAYHIPYYGSFPDYRLSPSSRFNLLEDNVISVFTPGDSSRKAGDIVKINFPSKDKGKPLNTSLDGNYLVRGIVHKLNINGKKYAHELILAKDALKTTPLGTFPAGKSNP